MTHPAPEDQRLLEAAEKFASDLTATVRAVVGNSADPFTARGKSQPHADTTGLVVRQHPAEGIVLCVDGSPMLKLKVSLRCTWDHRQAYLAVDDSSFEVLAMAGVSEPLFRVEYVRSPTGGVPSAHVHVHAHRDAFTHVMEKCGDKSTRAKRRRRSIDEGSLVPRLSELHFPLGGPRFRPCLEDVLQMLMDELGVDAADDAHAALAAGRATWRRMQLGASVRDSPETAARVLREMGYAVESPEGGLRPDRMNKLEAL